jgi:serine protease inhibitor
MNPIELDEIVQELGVKGIYSTGNMARMNDDPFCVIEKIVHAAKIELHERGTSVASVSGFMIKRLAIKSPPFVANRTFYIAIQDSATKTNFFLGKIEKPQ